MSDIVTAYHPKGDYLTIQLPCVMPVLMHELDHRKRWAEGMRDQWQLEASAMRQECAELMREDWSDADIMALSNNNQKSGNELALIRRGMK